MAKLYFRNPRLCTYILGYVESADGEPLRWDEIVEHFGAAGFPWKTVENRLYDLIAFGAIHKIGGTRPGQPRAVKLTPLGQAWLDHKLLAPPLFLTAVLERLDDEDDDEEIS